MRVRLVVAYDGGSFRGFAVNEGVETIGGILERTLSDLCGGTVRLTCAGRTDAGVHADAQVVHFDLPDAGDRMSTGQGLPEASRAVVVNPARWRNSIRSRSGGRIVLRALDVVDDGFDARFSARSRSYCYRLDQRVEPSPTDRRWAWWVPDPLDTRAMEAATERFIGEHDFSAFCRRAFRSDGTVMPSIRRIESAAWRSGPAGAELVIVASAFCQQMVRSIVGTLVEVGRGGLAPDDVDALLQASDRSASPKPAPPHGLTLIDVGYGELGSALVWAENASVRWRVAPSQ